MPDKASKAATRLSTFRSDLLTYRSTFATLRAEKEEQSAQESRSELLGRRPHAAHTPENPYSDSAAAQGGRESNPLFRGSSLAQQQGASGSGVGGAGTNPYSNYRSPYLSTDDGDSAREQHAFREQTFFSSTNATLDEYLERGRAVLGDLGDQRDMLKGTQRKLYSVANTLGISGDTIRMVERRAKQDKWIFWAGVVVFVVFVYFVLRWLR